MHDPERDRGARDPCSRPEPLLDPAGLPNVETEAVHQPNVMISAGYISHWGIHHVHMTY
jgi:hypothetical protein